MDRRHAAVSPLMMLGVVLVAWALLGCSSVAEEAGPVLGLFSPDQLREWRLTPTYADAKPWVFADGFYEAQEASWVGYSETFDDFVLECEFSFKGKQGGIVIRGDRDSDKPWESGYELDIDWDRDGEHGHVHFPVYPQPYSGKALLRVGWWYTLRIEARGERVSVFLESVAIISGQFPIVCRTDSDRKPVIAFTDSRFARGHICLEGQAGGVRYHNLRVRRLAQ